MYYLLYSLPAIAEGGHRLTYHIYLILSNQTSVEVHINKNLQAFHRLSGEFYINPYDQGWNKNIKRVFGDVPWYKWLVISWREPPPMMYDMVPSDNKTVRIKNPV